MQKLLKECRRYEAKTFTVTYPWENGSYEPEVTFQLSVVLYMVPAIWAEKFSIFCRGCLQQYADATGITRLARRRLAASHQPSVLRNLETVTARDVV